MHGPRQMGVVVFARSGVQLGLMAVILAVIVAQGASLPYPFLSLSLFAGLAFLL